MKEGDTPNPSPSSGKTPNLVARVKVLGNLSRLRNGDTVKEVNVAAPTNLSELVALLQEKYQLTLRRDSTLILVNGVEANALNDLDTVVSEGDEVTFIPMFHGG
jgi:molybdopterin converting factor small subunit